MSVYLNLGFYKIGTASELHRQTVDRAQRRFEEQLANSERELRWAMKQRRDYSSSSIEKRQAKQQLENLRTTLSSDYAQLIQVGKLFSSQILHLFYMKLLFKKIRVSYRFMFMNIR